MNSETTTTRQTMNSERRADVEESAVPRYLAEVRAFGYSAVAADSGDQVVAFPPSFFVIGAPRCGSTAVSDTLKANPHISFSVPKETHYFQQDRGEQTLAAWRNDYLTRYHPGLQDGDEALGDGSVSYLFAPEAVQRALEFDARAKFIVILRNPVEMIQSFHQRLLYLLDEDQEDFATAWALQESRAKGAHIPKLCREPRMLQYGDIGKFSAHLTRIFDIVPRDRCQVLLFEDLIDRPRESYLTLLKFIGVADDGQTEFVRKRESATFKSRWLQRLLMNPPDWLLRRVQNIDIKKIPRLKRLRKKLKRLNNRPASQAPLAPETREMLRLHFADDIERLAKLLDRDLSHWR